MRQTSWLFLSAFFLTLIFIAGCNPPATTTCSPYIGQATINEVSKAQQSGDSANDFVEIRILSASLTATTLNGWKILVCERGTTTCGGAQLSSATVTGTGANRYYVLKSLSNIGNYISFTNTSTTGTEIALADQNDDVVDYLSTAANTAHQPSCSFSFDNDADTASSSTRRIRRLPDGTGAWDVVNGNSQPPTEGANNSGAAAQHVAVTHAGVASTCQATNVTVSLHSGSHVLTSGITGTINLSTSTGRGLWARVTGNGTFVETGTADDGGASYTFNSSESSAVFSLRHSQPGSVNINISGAVTEDSTEDPALIFSNAALLIRTSSASALPTQISGKNSNQGWNSSVVQIEAVATDPDSGACIGLLSGSQTVKFGYQCNAPATCSASNMLWVNGTQVARNISTGSTAGTDVMLTFINSIAAIPLNYLDAGRITLSANKTLTDGSGVVLNGSATIVVRPFGFGFPSIVSGATYSSIAPSNLSGTASSGAGFIAAGSPFSASVAAYLFANGEDANNDGIPDNGANITDNGTTPSFAFTGAAVSMPTNFLTPLLASGGIAGALGGPVQVTFTSGNATLANMTYGEVGSLRLRVTASDYLNIADADIQGDSPDIGRFYPQNFALVTSSTAPITPLITPACSATSAPFTYMGQPFGLSYQLEARNASVPGAVTRNYDTSAGYTAGASAATIAYVAENANSGSPLNRVTAAAGRWDNGVYVLTDGASNFTVNSAVFARSTMSPVVDGPFSTVQLGIIATDADGRAIASLDMDATTTGACSPSCTAKAIGSTINLRYGRLALRDATGSDQASAIVIPALVEYYNSSQFVRNEDDSCTRYGASQINDVNYSNALAGYVDARSTSASSHEAGRWWLPTTDATMSAGLFANYPNALSIAPVPGATGTMGISLYTPPLPATPTIPAWLQFKWDGTNETGPSCKLTLGQARGNDHVVFWRERH